MPTDFPESDGTLEWESTTLVLVEASGGGNTGLGYTYADTATATLIHHLLAKVVTSRDVMAPTASWEAMIRQTRNLGRPGIVDGNLRCRFGIVGFEGTFAQCAPSHTAGTDT